MFTIFLFGPCEPLIPLLMYPATAFNNTSVFLVALTFGLTTIITMTAVVLVLYYGSKAIKLGKWERYTHAIAGFSILACGVAVNFLGL